MNILDRERTEGDNMKAAGEMVNECQACNDWQLPKRRTP
jgi:hypothetical protein